MQTTLQKHIDAYKAKLGINDENFIRPEGWREIALNFGREVAMHVSDKSEQTITSLNSDLLSAQQSIEWLRNELNTTRAGAERTIDATDETEIQGDREMM